MFFPSPVKLTFWRFCSDNSNVIENNVKAGAVNIMDPFIIFISKEDMSVASSLAMCTTEACLVTVLS